jgi:hypothetical protein
MGEFEYDIFIITDVRLVFACERRILQFYDHGHLADAMESILGC